MTGREKSELVRREIYDLRLYPEMRLCAKFDELCIDKYPIYERPALGFRVQDNCAEEHIM